MSLPTDEAGQRSRAQNFRKLLASPGLLYIHDPDMAALFDPEVATEEAAARLRASHTATGMNLR